ncbi:MAG: P1 family peptidase [Anaerolineae bacterium]|jgi:L-aminopeptidase/D-esterase-like protein|nr:P1 family peptidase [Anaerolineae bacterium]MBT4311878.1 P1 family peptidase [Anaerolineae bacterium]MBT4458352.1 P1 family peptidase [Anaerolineae bacterium]MBT6059895.1 P1 family peptidase [Anaerolineae bacterium]MBT6323063.1 P1 family peptidase [Anaerolineae bacterium]
MNNSITDVPGIEIGHAQDADTLTGCSVILCRKGAVAGVDQRGGAPGTRETDLLNPVNMVSKIHALLLSGGSAFGLDAATGVMRYLEEQKIGFDVGVAHVPIVPAAVLFDLALGSADIRPDAEMGYQAASSASAENTDVGNIGAGMGASVGKVLGMQNAMKAGLGTASIEIGGGVIVGAIVAVNAFGDVISPQTGAILAGARSAQVGPLKIGEEGDFANTLHTMQTLSGRTIMKVATRDNTVIGAVATNAKLTKAEATKVAQMAQDGLARTIRPAHTMLDGDTIFAISTGNKKADVSTIGAFAAEVMAQAILRGTEEAKSAGGLPGLKLE